jgi:hypothetical protein
MSTAPPSRGFGGMNLPIGVCFHKRILASLFLINPGDHLGGRGFSSDMKPFNRLTPFTPYRLEPPPSNPSESYRSKNRGARAHVRFPAVHRSPTSVRYSDKSFSCNPYTKQGEPLQAECLSTFPMQFPSSLCVSSRLRGRWALRFWHSAPGQVIMLLTHPHPRITTNAPCMARRFTG